jgi:hypothetical protein
MSNEETINDLIDRLNNEMDNINKDQIEYIINENIEFIFSGAIEH